MKKDRRRRARSGRRVRLLAPLAVVAVAGLLASACSSGSSPPSVAGLSGHDTTQTTGPLTRSQSDQAMVDFTRCMRAHGVQMSDPYHRPGHQGLSIDLPTPDSATQSAYSACNHFVQRIAETKGAGAAAQPAPRLQALTNYARCMRTHDIDMLDPNAQGALNLGSGPGMTTNFGRYSPQFRSADAACRHLLPAGIHDDGTGP